jgi:hypothetical protein
MYATLLVDGQVTGVWQLRDGTLVVDPFRPLTPIERADVEDKAARLLAQAAPGIPHDIQIHARRMP